MATKNKATAKGNQGANNTTSYPTVKPQKIKRVKDPVLQYRNSKNTGRGSLEAPEYDLTEIGRVEDVEGFVRQAFDKKIALMFKEGWHFKGKNPKTVNYIRARFKQFAQASNVPTEQLLRDIGRNIIRLNNAFLVKVRNAEKSGGKVRRDPNKKAPILPVAAYFSIPPETLKFKIGSGRVTHWQQIMPNGEIGPQWVAENVIHFHHDRKLGFVFGTPSIIPVLDDIRALRKIEENIELLVYQHLFPIYQYKIGSKDGGREQYYNEDGDSVVDVVRQEIQYMPSEGGIVTPWDHEIVMVGTEGKALRADGYLEYFKRRVVAGLGVSGVDFGEGACYTDDTQTLTENGWKYHHEIDHTKERIAAYNPKTKEIDFVIPNFKYEGFYEGNIVKFIGQHVDIAVTPHHDMWVSSRFSPNEWSKVHAIDIAKGKYKSDEIYLLENAPFKEADYVEELERIFIPAADTDKKMSGKTAPKPIECPTVDFAKLVGYYIAEGCLDKHNKYKVKISQNIDRHYLKMVYDIAKTGITFSAKKHASREREGVITLYGKTIYNWLKDNCPGLAKEKSIPRQCFQWPSEARKALLDAMLIGDGTHYKKSRNGFFTYYTTSEKLADDTQELAISVGYLAKKIGPLKQKDELHNDMWRVYITKAPRDREYNSRLINRHKHISVEKYSGIIYCYNVDNHLFLTRRNGKTTIQGNTVNRATSQTMSQNLINSVKDIQRTIEIFVDHFILRELLLEADFNFDPLAEENIVHLVFSEIDIDAKVKKENHYTDLWTKNAITQDEARLEMGRDVLEIPTNREAETDDYLDEKYPEWYRTFWKLIDEPKTLIQSVDEPASPAAQAAVLNNSTDITRKNLDEGVKQKENQTKLEAKLKKEAEKAKPQQKVPIRAKNFQDSVVVETFEDLKTYMVDTVLRSNMDTDYENYRREKKSKYLKPTLKVKKSEYEKPILEVTKQAAKPSTRFLDKWFKEVMDAAVGKTVVSFKAKCMSYFVQGYDSERGATEAGDVVALRSVKMGRNLLHSRADRYINRLREDIDREISKYFNDIEHFDKQECAEHIRASFDSFLYRARFIEDVEERKSFNVGRLAALKDKGYATYEIKNSNNPCNRCKQYSGQKITISFNKIGDLPPFHAGCDCRIINPEYAVKLSGNDEEEDGDKLERCVLSVKSDLRSKHPDWSEKKIKSAAHAICNSRMKGK